MLLFVLHRGLFSPQSCSSRVTGGLERNHSISSQVKLDQNSEKLLSRRTDNNDDRTIRRERGEVSGERAQSDEVKKGSGEAGALWTVIEEKEESLPGYPELLDTAHEVRGRR